MRPLGHGEISRSAAAFAAALLVLGTAWSAGPALAENATSTVRLTVDYGDGITKTIGNLAWAKGDTILDAMKTATARPHGISFSYTGNGTAAMLTRIDDVQNEGGGTGKKNWQYWVNDAYGDRSFAIFELQAQDMIVWRFTTDQQRK